MSFLYQNGNGTVSLQGKVTEETKREKSILKLSLPSIGQGLGKRVKGKYKPIHPSKLGSIVIPNMSKVRKGVLPKIRRFGL